MHVAAPAAASLKIMPVVVHPSWMEPLEHPDIRKFLSSGLPVWEHRTVPPAPAVYPSTQTTGPHSWKAAIVPHVLASIASGSRPTTSPFTDLMRVDVGKSVLDSTSKLQYEGINSHCPVHSSFPSSHSIVWLASFASVYPGKQEQDSPLDAMPVPVHPLSTSSQCPVQRALGSAFPSHWIGVVSSYPVAQAQVAAEPAGVPRTYPVPLQPVVTALHGVSSQLVPSHVGLPEYPTLHVHAPGLPVARPVHVPCASEHDPVHCKVFVSQLGLPA